MLTKETLERWQREVDLAAVKVELPKESLLELIRLAKAALANGLK